MQTTDYLNFTKCRAARASLVLAYGLFCAIVPTGFAQPAPLSAASWTAEEFYAHAVAQMRHRAEPAFATYDASIAGLNCDIQGANLDCSLGRGSSKSEAPFSVDLRENDDRLALSRLGESVVLGDSTFLNATWLGIDAIIQHGFIGTGIAPAATPHPIQPVSALPVIAVVSALSVANYIVYDAGAASCADGRVAHAVHLAARHDPLRYPLTGATVDLTTGDLCAVRFNAKISAAAGLVGATGGAELDLENVAGYEVVANERFDIDLRAIGIAVKHLRINVAYSNFAFPETIDPEVFTMPRPTGSPTPDAAHGGESSNEPVRKGPVGL